VSTLAEPAIGLVPSDSPTPGDDELSVIDSQPTRMTRDHIERIVQARHDAPHDVLGPHPVIEDATIVVRGFFPYAQRVSLSVGAPNPDEVAMRRIHDEGLFEAAVAASLTALDYEFVVIDDEARRLRLHDPYAFTEPGFSQEDEDSFVAGRHVRLYEKLGAHVVDRAGVKGVAFAVWAPHAQRVSVVGTFNRWDGRCHPMRRLGAAGVWDLFIPELKAGELYKFEMKARDGAIFLKGDPFAFRVEAHPNTASIIHDGGESRRWNAAWGHGGERAQATSERGVATYRLDLDHPDSPYQTNGDRPRLADAATEQLFDLVKKRGFTHIELAPRSPGHWGSASAFAPGEAYDTPEDLVAFVDRCHRHGVGVIVPAFDSRFPDSLAELAWFDGTQLYETPDPKAPERVVFAIDRGEVRSFLLSNAAFWVKRYHADGWRTDRRVAQLYRQLSRIDPEWSAGIKAVVGEPASIGSIPQSEVDRLVQARHDNPHSILGPHYSENTRELALRALIPGAERVCACFADEPEVVYELQPVHPDGLFATVLSEAEPGARHRLHVLEPDGRASERGDPYAFTDFAFTDFDQHLFGAGNHYRINEKLGSHPLIQGEMPGVEFAVWAPNAEGVSVVGPFNRWNGRSHPMQRRGMSGVWNIFIPQLGEGELYKYEVRAANGQTYLKSDPYAFRCEVPPATASIVYRVEGAHQWRDQEWMERRRAVRSWEQPIAIYEVHLGSWMRGPNNEPLSYIELAEKLIPHVMEMGFTHVELMPVAEHPYEPSWGYQVTGYYAPSARHGRPEDLMHFVDRCHQSGIGVILDWVPGHFPKDAHGLAVFDGTCLYEHADPRKGEHRDWGTLIFNYGRHEVENFLIANARFWLEHYHFDGLRVDAVASMLYLDYSRPNHGDWIPNKYGGRENLEAIEFLKHTNVVVHTEFPGVMMIAEESTAWPNVSRPVDQGGLGFGYKWNMGWMHDVLAYMRTPPEHRRYEHGKITFSLVYAFAENYVLSLSHDEVVHMKGSLLNKMPGVEWEKFANLRLMYAFMYAHPGKKLLFMGGEFGQIGEWDHAGGLERRLLENEAHRKLQAFVRELNRLYRSERAFFEVDFRGAGFEWLEANNAEESILAFLRKARDPRISLLFVMNFSATSRLSHRLGVPYPGRYRLILNSNARCYGGTGDGGATQEIAAEEAPCHGQEFSVRIPLPALSAVILKPAPPEIQ